MNTPESAFLSFAPELIQAIGEELDVRSLKDMRLACKHLANAFGPNIRRSATIDLNQSTIDRDMPKLRAFAALNSPFSQDTREITIRALSPTYNASYEEELWRNGEISGAYDQADAEILVNALQVEEELKESLLHALISLKGVHKLTWTPTLRDRDWAQAIVIEALKNLPNLRNLKLDHNYCQASLNLEEIAGLSSISIENANQNGRQLLESLSRMVAKSPQITSIDISLYLDRGKPTPVTYSLHHLVKYYPEKTPPLRLHHLGLNGCLLRLDDITMPHLRSLKSLRLTSHVDPSAAPPPGYPVDPTDEQKRVGSSEADIWKALEDTGQQLNAINHDTVTAPFLDYLSTCSGLKILNLTPDSRMLGPEFTNPLAVRFFKNSLLEHAHTLEELSINPHYEGGWSFSSHTILPISACVNLKKLGVAVIPSKLEYELKWFKDKGKVDAVEGLLDMVVAHLPHLESLTIFISDSESSRNATSGNYNWSMNHVYYTHQTIVNSIQKYTAPTSCQRLPVLILGTKMHRMEEARFKGKRKEQDSTAHFSLVYVSNK